MSCHEDHANGFIPGIEMSHISQRRIPNGMAYILGILQEGTLSLLIEFYKASVLQGWD